MNFSQISRPTALASILFLATPTTTAQSAPPLRVGVAETDITPELIDGKPVYIAGYGQNRPAKGVHDPLFSRAIVLSDGERRIALAAVDLVGLQYDAVQRIRADLPELDYVMVASTHNHEGPDVLGLWGPSPLKSGVDPDYVSMVVERTVETIRRASKKLVEVTATYGTARDPDLVRDSRKPIVKDDIMRVVEFKRRDTGQHHALLVDWSCHPEAMGPRNDQLTADFPYYTINVLKQRYQCPVLYFTSACGGLMAPPRDGITDAEGNELREGDFEYARVYGEKVAQLAMAAVESAQPTQLTPMDFAAEPISLPMENKVYQLGKIVGLLKRDAYVWTGDHNETGALVAGASAGDLPALVTEVSYLRLGELSIVGIPGEIYPELVYGKYQEPVEPNVDFPDAELETPVVGLVPDEQFMLIGLANDEIGYIIPLRQWDEQSPYAYGEDDGQYGESNSIGKQAAPIIMQALEERIAEVTKS